jgi:hypothetical protein
MDGARLLRVEVLDDPDVVHQATGMIAARFGVSCARALDHLSQHAALTGTSLLSVAQAVVGRARPLPAPAPQG